MNEPTRESIGTVHTHTHTQIYLFKEYLYNCRKKRYITNKINEIIKKEAILYRKVIGIISSAYPFIALFCNRKYLQHI